jgi:uncharacterized cupredoxin-like copper-binding protein
LLREVLKGCPDIRGLRAFRHGNAPIRALGAAVSACKRIRLASFHGHEEVKMKKSRWLLSVAPLALAAALSVLFVLFQASAHEGHEHFSAGEAGDPKKTSRTVKITMLEDGKRMRFEPDIVEIRLGEQIRFAVYNDGSWDHEFMLATKAENRKHAEFMKKFPEMEHDDPNAVRLSPLNSGEILWKFTKRGEFEYACLIPGHLEAGMHGKVVVK